MGSTGCCNTFQLMLWLLLALKEMNFIGPFKKIMLGWECLCTFCVLIVEHICGQQKALRSWFSLSSFPWIPGTKPRLSGLCTKTLHAGPSCLWHFLFSRQFSPCNSGWPGIHYVMKTRLSQTQRSACLWLLLSAGLKEHATSPGPLWHFSTHLSSLLLLPSPLACWFHLPKQLFLHLSETWASNPNDIT